MSEDRREYVLQVIGWAVKSAWALPDYGRAANMGVLDGLVKTATDCIVGIESAVKEPTLEATGEPK